MEFNPSPETATTAGDHLVVLGSPSDLKDLERAARLA
jgi:K+/H+ antiporter YhaU regulatory subunit KhtT